MNSPLKPFYIKFFSVILISCLGILIYSNTLHCSFHFDDNFFIIQNLAIRNIHNLRDIWGYFPCRFVVFLSFAINYYFDHFNVVGYHLFNIAVHLVSALLVWWLTRLTFFTPIMKNDKAAQSADLIALLAGLVFVSHPVQTESVTFIWQRVASMATMFYLASLCLYIKSRISRDSGVFYCFSLITAIMAMFSKETSITLPLVILLYEFTFLKEKGSLNWSKPFPFLIAILIIPWVTFFTNSEKIQYIHGAISGSPMAYLLTQFRVMVTYIRLDFFPFNLNLDYDYHISRSILEFPTLISLLFLITILFWAKHLFLKYRLVSFSIFWFFLTSLPESMPFPVKDVIFEHRLYLPLVGFSIFLVSGAYYLIGKRSIKTMIIILMMIVSLNSILTYQRNKIWKNDSALWDDAILRSPHKARPYLNRGLVYCDQGKTDLCLAYVNKAISVDPDYSTAYVNRGIIYEEQGRLIKAIIEYSKAIMIAPNNEEAYYKRAFLSQKLGVASQAILDFTKIIEIYPDFVEAYDHRAFNYYQLKKYDKAWGDVHKLEELGTVVDPGFISMLKKASGKDQ